MLLLLYLTLLFPFCESSTTPYSSGLNATTSGDRSCTVQKESSSLTYVVDTTGSMSDDLQELKRVNSWLLDRVTARFPCGVRQYTMVEFNDPTIGPVRITDSKAEFGNFFNSLIASGGGDCPELAMGGLQLALKNSPPKSFILVLTDASALDYSNTTLINNIRSLLNTSKSQVFFLITGLCGSIYSPDFLVYRDIAALSFGHVFQVALSDLNKVFNYLDFTLSRPANTSEHLLSGEYNAGNNSGSFSVANNFTALLITTDGVIYSIQVLGPDSVPLGLKNIVSEVWGSVYLLNKPVNGRWTIITYAGSQYSIRVEGLTAVNISSVDRCSDCHPNSTCEDYLGYKQCICKDGFIGDGFNCSDIDECAYSWTNNCSVGTCKNTFGSYTCLCPGGYSKSGNICVDIDECSSTGLNRCHALATCINYIGYYSCVCPYGYFGDGYMCEINECTRGACGLGMDCIKTVGSYQCSEPCTNHTILNEPWRSTSYTNGLNCDNTKNGWYRFIGSGGVRMPETCVPPYSCNTYASIWLNGLHPMISDGVVNRTVCASYGGSCCLWSSTVKIKACPGGYHVYKLSGTPSSHCTLSYCTDPNTTISSTLCAADEEWKLRSGVYGCYCKDKYEISAVADIKPQLTCETNDMKASFQKCQLKSLSYNVSSVTLKDSSCFGFQEEPITNTFSALSPLQAGRCGLQIIKNGTHAIYQNSLHLVMESTGIIQRGEELTVTMSCAYPLNMLISLNTVVNPLFGSTNISVGGTGQLTANMALYKDNSYVTPYNGSEVVLSSKSILYVGVFVQGGDSSRYNMVMKNCYATPTSRPDDSVKYYIIKDSCPNKQDSTISVLENGVSRKGRFLVEVFKFVGSYNYIYMHCAISMCDVTAGSCTPSCSGSTSRSAASDESYQLSVGPVIREDTLSQSSGSVGTHESYVLLGLVFFLLVGAPMV